MLRIHKALGYALSTDQCSQLLPIDEDLDVPIETFNNWCSGHKDEILTIKDFDIAQVDDFEVYLTHFSHKVVGRPISYFIAYEQEAYNSVAVFVPPYKCY